MKAKQTWVDIAMEIRGLHAWTLEIMKIEYWNINEYFVLIGHQT